MTDPEALASMTHWVLLICGIIITTFSHLTATGYWIFCGLKGNASTKEQAKQSTLVAYMTILMFLLAPPLNDIMRWIHPQVDPISAGFFLHLPALTLAIALASLRDPGWHTGAWAIAITITLAVLAVNATDRPHITGLYAFAVSMITMGHLALAVAGRTAGTGPLGGQRPELTAGLVGIDLAALAMLVITRS